MTEHASLLPWQTTCWQHMLDYRRQQRIPHALLLSGTVGLGKLSLACYFVQLLLCQACVNEPCNDCSGCRLFNARTHPDFSLIQPEEPNKPITVNMVRAMTEWLMLKPHYAGYRVIIIRSADQLNRNAANSLLKTLEEPVERTVILLLTAQPSALPATILSRCQKMILVNPDKNTALTWLHQQGIALETAPALLGLAHGAPLQALKLANSNILEQRNEIYADWLKLLRRQNEPVLVAEQWQRFSLELILDWMTSWVYDIVRLHWSPHAAALANPDCQDQLQRLAKTLNLRALFGFIDELVEAKRYLGSQLNRQLLLEALLIHWFNLDSNHYE